MAWARLQTSLSNMRELAAPPSPPAHYVERKKYRTELGWHERVLGPSPWRESKEYRTLRKIGIALSVLILSGCIASVFYSRRASALESDLDSGIFANQQRDYAEAQTLLKRVIASSPSNALAHYELGNASYMLGDETEAIRRWTEAFRLDPAMDQAYIARGVAYFSRGDYAASLQDFHQAVVLRPSMETYLQQGLALQALGRHEEAIDSFDQAIGRSNSSNLYAEKARSLSRKALDLESQAETPFSSPKLSNR